MFFKKNWNSKLKKYMLPLKCLIQSVIRDKIFYPTKCLTVTIVNIFNNCFIILNSITNNFINCLCSQMSRELQTGWANVHNLSQHTADLGERGRKVRSRRGHFVDATKQSGREHNKIYYSRYLKQNLVVNHLFCFCGMIS